MASTPSHPSSAGSVPRGRSDTYRKVFDRVADAIIIHDKRTHRIVDVNACAIKRYGYTLEELRGMTPFDLHPAEEYELVAEKIDVKNAESPNVYVHVAKDGRRFDVEILSDEVVYEGVEAWLSIARDISDRKRAEAEIARARDDALAASKHKSDFLAAMSHELRTPMNGVLGMATLLLETHLTEEQREYGETIRGAGEVMLELLNELLDLSKIEAGRLEIEPHPFDLRQSVESVCKLLSPRVREAGIDLILDFAREVPSAVVGDEGRIRQILTNLTGNAIKFTREGHVALRVSCLEMDPVYCILEIAVEDTGIGIPEEKLESIFEEFSQADQTIFRRYGGTGLGLAISRRMVELMGGRLQVESTPGEGSIFRVTLPLPRAASVPPVDTPQDRRGWILLVQRDAERRDRVERWLGELGFSVEPAHSGSRALERLSERLVAGDPPFGALVDFHLPDLDGVSLGRAILARSDHGVRVWLTGLEGSGGREGIHAADFAGHLPWGFEERHLRELMDLPSTPDGAPSHAPAPEPSAPEPARRAEECSGRRPCVLVVEDNDLNQRVVRRMLDRLGCRVDVAEDGPEALRRVETSSYQLILMDCELPGMDGYEATRQIRALPAPRRAIPIVALTADAMAGAQERCLEAGMDAYLSKPASLERIQNVLESWIPGYRAPLEPDDAAAETRPDPTPVRVR